MHYNIAYLVYGVVVNAIDEYCWLGKCTVTKAMKEFVMKIWACYKTIYLRKCMKGDIEMTTHVL
jgi:hypothetical protein